MLNHSGLPAQPLASTPSTTPPAPAGEGEEPDAPSQLRHFQPAAAPLSAVTSVGVSL